MSPRAMMTVISMMAISAFAIVIQLQFTATLAKNALNLVADWALVEIAISYSLAICALGTEATITSLVASRSESKFGSIFLAYMLVAFTIFAVVCAPLLLVVFHFFLEVSLKRTIQVIFAVGIVNLVSVAAMLLRASKQYLLASLLEKSHWWGLGLAVVFYWTTREQLTLNVFDLIFCVALVIVVPLAFTVFKILTTFELNQLEIRQFIRWTLHNPSTFMLTLNGILVALYERFDQVVLRAMLGAEALAVYFICFKISFAVRFMTKSINQFFLPLLARSSIENGPQSAVAMINKNIKIGSILAVPIVALAIFFSSNVLEHFEAAIPDAILAAQILAISGFLSISNLVVFGYIGTQNGGKLVLSNGVMSLSVQMVILILLLPSLNVIAPAVARISAVAVGNSNAYRYARKNGHKINLLSNTVCGALMLCAVFAYSFIS